MTWPTQQPKNRPVDQDAARAVNRLGPGLRAGTRAGLGPVSRPSRRRSTTPAPLSGFALIGHAARKSSGLGYTSRANGDFLTYGTVDYDLGDTSWLTIQTESGTADAGINLTVAGLYLVSLYAETGTSNPGTGAYVDFEDIDNNMDLATMDFVQPFGIYTNRKAICTVPVAVGESGGHILRARFFGSTTSVYNTLHVLKVL